MLKGKQIMIYETDLHFFAYVLVEDTFKCMIGKFHPQNEVYNYIGRHLKYKTYV